MEDVNLLIHGLSEIEKKLIMGVCRLSQRRDLTINLLPEVEASFSHADVMLIDNEQKLDVEVAELFKKYQHVPTIWVDRENIPSNHISLMRPVQWMQLPLHITEAFKQNASTEQNKVEDNSNDLVTSNYQKTSQVLIVDDSLVVRQQLEDVLSKRGYQVSVAASGEEALEKYKPNHFDNVLLDVVMPNVDGYEICRKIKSMDVGFRQTPIIMLTSKSSPFDKIRGKMAGCDAYLTKPVSLDNLMAVLAK